MNNPRNRNQLADGAAASARATLPGLPAVPAVDNKALYTFLQALKERLEVREGSRGNPFEAVVTRRDLVEAGLLQGNGFAQGGEGGAGTVLVNGPDGTYRPITIDAFSAKIFGTQLFKKLTYSLTDPSRFNYLPEEVRALVANSIADEAAKRGADIQEVEFKQQSATRSLAYKLQEVTASVANASAGVREVSYALATGDTAQAGKITQLEASLGNYYADGTPGRAVLEQTLTTTASRIDGLSAEYMVKVSAGGAVAGVGLTATEDPSGATRSSFIVQAGDFALVAPYAFAQAGTPSATAVGQTWYNSTSKLSYRATSTGSGSWVLFTPVAPFGVDTTTGQVFINGSLRINAGGAALQDSMSGTNGDSVDIVFRRSASTPATPGASASTPAGWYDTPNLVPASLEPMWSAVGQRPSTGTTYTWGAPIRIEGTSAAEVTVFRRSATPPATPTGGTYVFSVPPVLTPPALWFIGIPAGTEPVYTSRAVVSAPAGVTAPVAITGWTATSVSFQNGTNGTNGTDGPQGVQGPNGPEGQPRYTWIRYATSAAGAGISNDPTGKSHIGFAYNKLTATESNTPADYTFASIQGPIGNTGVIGPVGPEGLPRYTWIKYSANANGAGLTDLPQSNTAFIGISPNQTALAESNTPSDYVWSAFKGETGPTGLTGTGSPGPRGSVSRYISGSSWSDAAASSAVGWSPINGDTVTISNGSSFAQMRTFNGSSWVLPGVVIDGSLLVSGSITTAKLVAGSLVGYNIRTATFGSHWTMGVDNFNNQLQGVAANGVISISLDSSVGSVVCSGVGISRFVSTSTEGALDGFSDSGSSTGFGVQGRSINGHGVVSQGNASRSPLLLTSLGSLPSNRTAGSLCSVSGQLFFANGAHWYRVDGLVQVT